MQCKKAQVSKLIIFNNGLLDVEMKEGLERRKSTLQPAFYNQCSVELLLQSFSFDDTNDCK